MKTALTIIAIVVVCGLIGAAAVVWWVRDHIE